jgi:hypothetical protein
MLSRTWPSGGVRPVAPAGRSSGIGDVRGVSTGATAGGTVWAGGVVAEAAGAVAGGVAGGRDGAVAATGFSTCGTSTTAGTGSIATRGGGSGISKGTAAALRPGFDAHPVAHTIAAATTSLTVSWRYTSLQYLSSDRQKETKGCAVPLRRLDLDLAAVQLHDSVDD